MRGAASGGPLALQAGLGCSGVRFCSLRAGALEEKAGLCRGAAWPVWPRLPGPSQGTLGATLEPCGCDPSVPWGGGSLRRRPTSEPLFSLPEPSCVGRGAGGGGPQEPGGAQAAARTLCLFLALASTGEARASLSGGLHPKPVQPRGGSGASRSWGGWVLGQS